MEEAYRGKGGSNLVWRRATMVRTGMKREGKEGRKKTD